MAQQFKTTFIPKQAPAGAAPAATASAGGGMSGGGKSGGAPSVKVRRSTSIMTVLTILVLFAAIIISAGAYLFERGLSGRIAAMTAQLQTAEKQFEPTFLETLHELDQRLALADQVLRNHITLTPFFILLEERTLKSVEYDNFLFSIEEGIGVAQFTGKARSYQAVAQQASEFDKENLFGEYIFSDFTLLKSGRVQFNLVMTLSPELLNFEKSHDIYVQPEADFPILVAPPADGLSPVTAPTTPATAPGLPTF